MSGHSLQNLQTDFQKLLTILKEGSRFIITTHVNPDPDGIGAEMGMYYLLQAMGKSSVIINGEKIPGRYLFMDPEGLIRVYDELKMNGDNQSMILILLDCSDSKRIGKMGDLLKKEGLQAIAIDHHDNVEPFPGMLFNYPESASTSELIYELYEAAGIEVGLKASMAMYLGILMDTGQFKYNKTRPRTHEITAKLLRHKFPTEELTRKLFEDFPYQKLLLKKDIYQTLEMDINSGIAWVSISRELIQKFPGLSGHGDSIVNELLSPLEIKIAAVFTEMENDMVKTSFRSKGSLDVCSIAKLFGGGGHRNAAGTQMKGSLASCRETALEKLRELVYKS